jgi:hypothetical protein
VSEGAPQSQRFFRVLTSGLNPALMPRNIREQLEQFRRAGAIVIEPFERGERVLVVGSGIVPRAQTNGFVSCQA